MKHVCPPETPNVYKGWGDWSVTLGKHFITGESNEVPQLAFYLKYHAGDWVWDGEDESYQETNVGTKVFFCPWCGAKASDQKLPETPPKTGRAARKYK